MIGFGVLAAAASPLWALWAHPRAAARPTDRWLLRAG